MEEKDPHLAHALVEIHVTLHLADLIDSELNNPTFALFDCRLLSCHIECPLSLYRGLLNLEQDLRAFNAPSVVSDKTKRAKNLSQSVVRE
jgi:hypothetical protein